MTVEPGIIPPGINVTEGIVPGSTIGATPVEVRSQVRVAWDYMRIWEFPKPTPEASWTRVWACDNCNANFTEAHLLDSELAVLFCSDCEERCYCVPSSPPDSPCCKGSRWVVRSWDEEIPCPMCEDDWKDPTDYIVGIVLSDKRIFINVQDT